ncbi:MAG: hypothetical protein HC875_16145 [Anaerolineales bacterium]|nr:hypothetical protein [Anaerolineales bacterium]
MASVIGETFFTQVLAVLTAGEEDLSRQMATLEADRYVLPGATTDLGPTYAFRHSLIQESAYSTLLYERRRAYHRQVAESLERFFPGRIAEQSGLLAYHYERASDFEQAIYYHLQTADQARLLYANEEAEMLYQRVLKLLDEQEAAGGFPNSERRAKTYLKLAQVRANQLDFEGAQEFYDRAFELLEQVERDTPPTFDTPGNSKPLFRVGVFEPTTLDPGLIDTTDDEEIIKNLFEGLTELDTELNIIPAVARRWHVDETGQNYQFELRSGLKWSDGTPLTAHDFVFAWRRNLHPDTVAAFAQQLYVVQGAEDFHQGRRSDPASIAIRALDDLTLEITLTAPTPYFPYLLATSITFPQPAHIVQVNEAGWMKLENLVCNGPFRVEQWQPGREMLLTRSAAYHGYIPGNLEQALLLFIDVPNLDDYLANRIDWCPLWKPPELLRHRPDETYLVQYLGTFFLEFACKFPPFNQKLVRQAFARAINLDELMREVWANGQRAASGGVVPPGMSGHSPEIGLNFDPIAARNLLRQAGFNSGADLPPLTLVLSPGFDTTPNFLQSSWREHLEAHVQVIEGVSIEEIAAMMKQGVAQLSLSNWDVDYPDPDDILRVLFHSASPNNYLGWQNQQFDQAVEQAARLTNYAARLALYHQADRILVAEDTAVVPLYYRQGYGLLNPGFTWEGSGRVIRGGTFKFKNIRAI